MQEQWRDIPGFEGLYQASATGEIRTKPGKVTSNKRYKQRVWQTRVLKQKFITHGKRKDAAVTLWKDGTSRVYLVSRLVAMTWVDGYAPDLTVNHIDGKPSNNCSTNLEWVILAENLKKGFEQGLFANVQVPVSLKSATTEYPFRSMAEASRFLGRNKGYIHNCLRKKRAARGVDGNAYTILLGSETA